MQSPLACISKRTKSDRGTPSLPSGPGICDDASEIFALSEVCAALPLSSVCVSACSNPRSNQESLGKREGTPKAGRSCAEEVEQLA